MFVRQINDVWNFPTNDIKIMCWVSLVTCGNTAQLIVVCQSECLDLKWIDILRLVFVFTLLMPWMDVDCCVPGNLIPYTHPSEMKFNCNALSNKTACNILIEFVLNFHNGCCQNDLICWCAFKWAICMSTSAAGMPLLCRIVVFCSRNGLAVQNCCCHL
jgi:hypothetical protein